MLEFLLPLVDWTKQWLLALHPGSLFLLAFVEAIFFPVPPDLVLIPLARLRPPMAPLFGILATLGSVAGASVGYLIGLRGGRPVLNRFVSADRIGQIEKMFQRYDVWATGMAGFTPLPYKVFALSAGVFYLNFPRFIIASLVSRGARFMLEAILIMHYGEGVEGFLARHFGWFTLAVAGVVIVAFALIQRRKVESGV